MNPLQEFKNLVMFIRPVFMTNGKPYAMLDPGKRLPNDLVDKLPLKPEELYKHIKPTDCCFGFKLACIFYNKDNLVYRNDPLNYDSDNKTYVGFTEGKFEFFKRCEERGIRQNQAETMLFASGASAEPFFRDWSVAPYQVYRNLIRIEKLPEPFHIQQRKKLCDLIFRYSEAITKDVEFIKKEDIVRKQIYKELK